MSDDLKHTYEWWSGHTYMKQTNLLTSSSLFLCKPLLLLNTHQGFHGILMLSIHPAQSLLLFSNNHASVSFHSFWIVLQLTTSRVLKYCETTVAEHKCNITFMFRGLSWQNCLVAWITLWPAHCECRTQHRQQFFTPVYLWEIFDKPKTFK